MHIYIPLQKAQPYEYILHEICVRLTKKIKFRKKFILRPVLLKLVTII